jgi:hypothetical protein
VKDKAVDAVGAVRKIRDELYERTKEMSTDELIAFYRGGAATAKEKLARLHAGREEAARGR